MFKLLSRNNTPMPITTSAGRMPGTELLPRQSSCSCMSSAYGGGVHESSPNRRTPQFYRRVRTVWRVTIAAPSPPATGVSSRSRAAVARLIGEMHDLRPAADGPGDVVFDGEDEFPAQCPRFGQNGGERGVEQMDAPIAASAGRVRDQAKIVHQYQAVALDGVFDHAEECLLDGRRSLRLARVHELPCAQKHPSPGGLHGLQNRGFAGARRAAEYCHRAHREVAQQAVGSLLLGGSENDFEIYWIRPATGDKEIPNQPGVQLLSGRTGLRRECGSWKAGTLASLRLDDFSKICLLSQSLNTYNFIMVRSAHQPVFD